MTLNEFNALSIEKRSDIVWDWGYIISDRKTETEKKVLFAISVFFVEISFSLADQSLIDIQGIEKKELHRDYFSNIDKDNPFFRAAVFSAATLIRA